MHMEIRELILKNRSYRRFDESRKIDDKTLRELVDLARSSGSAANRQPLKFVLSNTPEMNARVFPCTAWAGNLKDWPGPAEGERPAAYIIILADTEIAKKADKDAGIASQSILLGAVNMGLGGCMIGSLKRDELRSGLNIPERYEINLVIAIGKPAEKVVIEDVKPDGNIGYYRDSQDVHHVPKRTLDELILTF